MPFTIRPFRRFSVPWRMKREGCANLASLRRPAHEARGNALVDRHVAE